MPDIFYLLSKWWKPMLSVVLLSLITVALITFLKPRQYLSVVTALPASSVAADKARLYNKNIEYLYSGLGSPDDLDRIIGTAQLDTIYLAVTDQFNLYDHYKINLEKEKARIKAAKRLKKYTQVFKSDYGELKVKVWDTDKNLAPQLANAILDKLETIHRYLQSRSNQLSYKSLQSTQQKIRTRIDSLDHVPGIGTIENGMPSAQRKILFDQWQENEKLINEYQIMIDNSPPVLMVVEEAKAATKPDKPKPVQVLIAVALLSIFFAFLLALILERRKTTA
ncbi:MAG: hypothetical protein JJE22_16480, partial [Bacteroidia bacterium]|nr:hypothetical protein [Bacteroidia bacterium]